MKFFVPEMEPAEAEQVWAAARAWLAQLGLKTTRRRIRALAWTGGAGGRDHYVAVGDDLPSGEDLVMLILEASRLDLFYVCTPGRGIVDDIPYPMSLDESWRVIDFDEEAYGTA